MADNNASVIDGAEGGNAPISPNRNRILLLGILVGIALPGVGWLMALFMDTRVHSRKEIEKAVSVPFLGEIPYEKRRPGNTERTVPERRYKGKMRKRRTTAQGKRI